MPFDVELIGTLAGSTRRRLAELVGDDAVDERSGHVVVTVRDQAAMIAVLHRLDDLGLDIDRIERI